MSTVPQELIEAAARKGIVPGAVVRCAFVTTNTFTVPHWDEIEYGTHISTVSFVDVTREGSANGRNYGYLKYGSTWATVIEPAPCQGLEEGMATECSPAMRAAIIERAAELGLSDGFAASYNNKWITWCDDCGTCPIQSGKHGENILTPLDFLTRLEATGKKPKPLKIGEWNVKFEKGSIEVGCQRITNETVRAIAAKLKD